MAENGITLIPAGPEHASEVAAIHHALFVPPWSVASLLELLQHPASASLVAYADEDTAGAAPTPAGFLIGQFAADQAEILSIGVAPGWQRRGIGRRLLIGWTALVRDRGATRLFLDVAADNSAAVSLYRAADFQEVGHRNGYYQRANGAACDALVLARQL